MIKTCEAPLKKRLLLGTTNPAKVSIVRAALDPLPVEIVTPADLDITVDVQEDGDSTAENAEKKARAYFAEAGIPTLGIDGGLQIEGLPAEKQPGVLVRRIHDGERDATDADVLDHYARELAQIGGEAIGIWQGSVVLVLSNAQVYAHTYTFKTRLTSRRRGGVTPGAPLDALAMDPATGRYFSEMTWQERPDLRWVLELVRQHLDEL